MANAVWMISAWSVLALNPRVRPDVLIFGTDPVLSPLVAFSWRLFRPKVKIAHWCFDLYPEAAISAGLIPAQSRAAKTLKALLRKAYRRCDLIIDIGLCMRGLLAFYGSPARVGTITPWALAEPEAPVEADPAERRELFGEATLCLLYSGSFGRAHSWRGIPELSFALKPAGGQIVFSVRGNATQQLIEAVREAGAPVLFAPPVGADRLEARLSAADVHIVSLHEEWTGTVVPSKFFGALAIGRPVLFIGSRDSSIAKWIEEFQVGWVLDEETRSAVVTELLALCADPDRKASLFRHCHEVYHRHFGRTQALNTWDQLLRPAL